MLECEALESFLLLGLGADNCYRWKMRPIFGRLYQDGEKCSQVPIVLDVAHGHQAQAQDISKPNQNCGPRQIPIPLIHIHLHTGDFMRC